MTQVLDLDTILNIFLILVFAALVVAILNNARRDIRKRTREVQRAREALDRHFNAMEIVAASSVPSDDVKRLLANLSLAVNSKSVAHAVANAVASGERPHLSPRISEQFERIWQEISELTASDSTIGHAVREAIEFGYASMLLRWPETWTALYPDVVVEEAAIDVERCSAREKAYRLFSAEEAQGSSSPFNGTGFVPNCA